MKLAGICIIVTMSVLSGWIAAGALKKRVSSLRYMRELIESLILMIRYEALEVDDIALRLSDTESFDELSFVKLLGSSTEKLRSGENTFREIWDMAADKCDDGFAAEDTELLRRIGSVIGSCDTQGQLSALSLYAIRADKLISDAEEQYKSKGRLYRSLGAVAGALMAVIAV